ncbi:YdgA family protein [Photorhabdus luminescens]|uniref:YdgA family protein n=1 Tax=Photorhabdus luminescens TaxID=29488 RepID=UPI00223EE3C2|nr:YdgA family protein [Photorhabdus luminescens]MCW7762791.1 YdgA family protein [Photorhabdus luminescens subsp. venezuelensis]
MKKSLVAVGIIVALGAAWTGASWYTGKQIEKRIDQSISRANAEMKKAFPETSLMLQSKDFHRGVFSSDVRIVLTTKDGVKNAKIKPGEEISIKSVIDHGPFPLAQVKKLTLIPSLASVHSELENNETLKPLFAITKGKSLFTSDSRVSYSGSVISDVDLIPVDFEQNGAKFNFSGAKLTSDLSRDLKEISLAIKSDQLAINKNNENFLVKGIDLNLSNKKGKFDIYIGDQSIKIQEVSLKGIGNEDMILSGVKIDSNIGEDETNLKGKITYSLDGLKLKNIDFGSGQFVITADRLDGEAVRKFTQAYNDATAKSLSSDAADTAIIDAVASNLPVLLKNNPQFGIEPLTWKNAKGESTINYQVSLKNLPKDKSSLYSMKTEEAIRALIQNMSLNVTLPRPMMIEFSTQSMIVNGMDKAKAEQNAEQQIKQFEQLGQLFKITTVDKDAISIKFNYADGNVEMNGKKMSLHQFMSEYGLSDPSDDSEAPESDTHDSGKVKEEGTEQPAQ